MTSAAPGVRRQSRRLRDKLEVVLPVLFAAGRRLFGHPDVRALYPEYLFTTHCIIRASVPVLREAIGAARNRAADPVAMRLAEYLASHVGEELDHDEWLLDDLASIGVPREDLVRRPPSATVASLVGAQYYWIRHYHPVALLGYIMLLEGYPISQAEVDRLRERTGYPEAAFRTLAKHSELDPGHGAELDAVIDELPLTPQQWTAVSLNALSSAQLMTRAIDEIVEGTVLSS